MVKCLNLLHKNSGAERHRYCKTQTFIGIDTQWPNKCNWFLVSVLVPVYKTF